MSRKEAWLRRLGINRPPLMTNFGDEIGPLLVTALSGMGVRHSNRSGKLLTVGSIFFAVKDYDTVWGSGLVHDVDTKFASNARSVELLAVRGPKTRDALLKAGIDCPKVMGDPALLVPHVFDIPQSPREDLGFVPHWSQVERFRNAFGSRTNHAGMRVKIIDLTANCAAVMDEISRCRYVISSSLHGVIVADALGIPALPVVFEKPLHNDPFKFHDYMNSTDREYSPVELQMPIDLDDVVRRAEAMPKPRIDLLPLLRSFPYRRYSSFAEVSKRPLELAASLNPRRAGGTSLQ
jgi:pyruvyltransferase